MLRYKQRVVKGFEAFSKDRKQAANAFRNPLETQLQLVSRGLKLFGNPLKLFANPLKLFENPLEALWKLFTNPLEAL